MCIYFFCQFFCKVLTQKKYLNPAILTELYRNCGFRLESVRDYSKYSRVRFTVVVHMVANFGDLEYIDCENQKDFQNFYFFS